MTFYRRGVRGFRRLPFVGFCRSPPYSLFRSWNPTSLVKVEDQTKDLSSSVYVTDSVEPTFLRDLFGDSSYLPEFLLVKPKLSSETLVTFRKVTSTNSSCHRTFSVYDWADGSLGRFVEVLTSVKLVSEEYQGYTRLLCERRTTSKIFSAPRRG